MTSVNSHSDRTVVDGFCGPAARHRHRGMSGHAGHRVGDIPTPRWRHPSPGSRTSHRHRRGGQCHTLLNSHLRNKAPLRGAPPRVDAALSLGQPSGGAWCKELRPPEPPGQRTTSTANCSPRVRAAREPWSYGEPETRHTDWSAHARCGAGPRRWEPNSWGGWCAGS